MCFNEGKIDRVIRVLAGLGLIGYGVITANIILASIGGVLLITGVVGFCALYALLKINTGCKK